MLAQRTRAGFLTLALAVNFVLLGGLDVRHADACSCAGVPSAEEGLRTSDAVFWGEVTNVESQRLSPGDNPFLDPVTFDVKEYWKGTLQQSVTVYGQGASASCGLNFEKGKSYLVFAYRSGDDEDAPLGTDLCSATGPLMNVEAASRALGPPTDQLPDTGGSATSLLDRGTLYIVAVILALLTLAGVLMVRGRGHP